MATPAYVSHNVASANSTSVNVIVPSGIANGDLLVVYGVHSTGNACSLGGAASAEGYTEQFRGSTTTHNSLIAAKLANNESASHTFSWTTSDDVTFTVTAFTGNHQTLASAIHAASSLAQTGTCIAITLGVTTTVASTLLAMWADRDAAGVETACFPNMTDRFDYSLTPTFMSQSMATEAASATGAYSRYAEFSSNNRRNIGTLLAIAPPASTGGAEDTLVYGMLQPMGIIWR